MLHPSVNVRILRSFLKCLSSITTFHPSLDPSRTRSSNENPYTYSIRVASRYSLSNISWDERKHPSCYSHKTQELGNTPRCTIQLSAGKREKKTGGAERSFASQSFAVTSCYKSPTTASHAQLTVYKGEVLIKVQTSRKGFPVGY
jgi:hypothetical protein